MTLDPATGWLNWLTGEGNGPANYRITVFVRDNGAPALTDSLSFNLAVREHNSPPALALIPDATVREGALLTFAAQASDRDIPANRLRFSLTPDAPQGATVDPLTGVFSWRPREFQGPSSNRFRLTVTDDGAPPLSATREFAVVVRDVLSDFNLGLGSTHLRAGQSAGVPVRLVSGAELTRLDFQLRSPSPALLNLRLEPLAPEIDAAVLQPLGGDAYAAAFFVVPGSALDGDRDIARLRFDTADGQSASASLLPGNVTALGIEGATLRGAGAPGNVFVVARQPAIELRPGASLILHGLTGKTYSLETASGLGSPPSWRELRRVTFGADRIDESLPAADGVLFLRLREIE
jgi:hypothetical protein